MCIDAEGEEVWSTGEINRSMSTPAIDDGLLFVADYTGFLYCFDARTGEEHWKHDTMGVIWGSRSQPLSETEIIAAAAALRAGVIPDQ